jgi:hypothetical protein
MSVGADVRGCRHRPIFPQFGWTRRRESRRDDNLMSRSQEPMIVRGCRASARLPTEFRPQRGTPAAVSASASWASRAPRCGAKAHGLRTRIPVARDISVRHCARRVRRGLGVGTCRRYTPPVQAASSPDADGHGQPQPTWERMSDCTGISTTFWLSLSSRSSRASCCAARAMAPWPFPVPPIAFPIGWAR